MAFYQFPQKQNDLTPKKYLILWLKFVPIAADSDRPRFANFQYLLQSATP